MTSKRKPKHEPEVEGRAVGRPRARPHPLDPGVCDAICERLIAGDSIGSICDDPSMPARRDVYIAMATNADFGNAIARAREAQQDAEAERIVEMADAATMENWQLVKFRVWARQWRAAKLAPKKYGERQFKDVTIDGPQFADDALIQDILSDIRAIRAKNVSPKQIEGKAEDKG